MSGVKQAEKRAFTLEIVNPGYSNPGLYSFMFHTAHNLQIRLQDGKHLLSTNI